MRVCGHQNRELLANLSLGDPGAQGEEQGQAGEQQEGACLGERQQEGIQEDLRELGSPSGEQGVAGDSNRAARVSQQEQGFSQEQPLGRTRLQTIRAKASTLGELEPG